jgi:hypothetical protein
VVRRVAPRLAAASLLCGLALSIGHCGLLAPPGDYASAGETDAASSEGGGGPADGGDPRRDSDAPEGSAGTLAILAGERNPITPDDNPAWASDLWLAVLDAEGHVVRWDVQRSAPIAGPFDSAALVEGVWFALSQGYGVSGGRGHALQSIGWDRGPVGDWQFSRVAMPGGLGDVVRGFVGARVVTVGGVRSVEVDGGTETVFTREVHLAELDTATRELGAFERAGVSLEVRRIRPGLVASGGHLYVVGGRTDGYSIIASVEMADVDEQTGDIGAFSVQPSMTHGGQDHRVFMPAVTVADGFLFVAGGRINGSNTPSDIVLVAPVDPETGGLGDFRAVTRMPRPLRDFGFVAHAGTLYVIGGEGVTTRADEVLSARIGPDGELGPWHESENAKMPSARAKIVATAY